jgi:hypothetical protein
MARRISEATQPRKTPFADPTAKRERHADDGNLRTRPGEP